MLFGGKSGSAQVYLAGLCGAICVGIRNQTEWDRTRHFVLFTINIDDARGGMPACSKMLNHLAEGELPTVCEPVDSELQSAWGDVSGT